MKSKFIGSLLVNGSLAIICLLWTIPTLGLLISSFRDRIDISNTGWWTVFPHQDWVSIQKITPAPVVDRYSPMTLGGITATFEQFDQRVLATDGKKYIWIGNRRIGYLDVEAYTWTADTTFTLENYKQVLASGHIYCKACQWKH